MNDERRRTMRTHRVPQILAPGLACSLLLLGLAATGCASRPARPHLDFAPYGPGYQSKPDFARVERDHPLTDAQRAELTPENLEALTQEELDQLYARLSAGPIPDGPYRGSFFFAAGGGLARVPEVLGGFKELAVDLELKKINFLGESLWKGKVFYRDRRELRNMIFHRKRVGKLFGVDPARMRTLDYHGRKVGLLFPAKLYCGQSLLDGRRESVIIDYAFGDELEGYLPEVDELAGRNGLQVRDEIRRIRPGLYLGRAYLGRVFGLNFVLYNEEAASRGTSAEDAEDCWAGAPPPTVAAR